MNESSNATEPRTAPTPAFFSLVLFRRLPGHFIRQLCHIYDALSSVVWQCFASTVAFAKGSRDARVSEREDAPPETETETPVPTRTMATEGQKLDWTAMTGPPKKVGLYDPAYEKDACGIGFIADLKRRATRSTVVVSHTLTLTFPRRPSVPTGPGWSAFSAHPARPERAVSRRCVRVAGRRDSWGLGGRVGGARAGKARRRPGGTAGAPTPLLPVPNEVGRS